jgi:hypothetical protein
MPTSAASAVSSAERTSVGMAPFAILGGVDDHPHDPVEPKEYRQQIAGLLIMFVVGVAALSVACLGVWLFLDFARKLLSQFV